MPLISFNERSITDVHCEGFYCGYYFFSPINSSFVFVFNGKELNTEMDSRERAEEWITTFIKNIGK